MSVQVFVSAFVRYAYIFLIFLLTKPKYCDIIYRVAVAYYCLYADVAKLAYAPDLGSGGSLRAGSSPVICIIYRKP